MINPRISIITVTFNAEKVLERTLESIRRQNYDNIECIVVDGASSDDTLKIVDKYSDIITKSISEKDEGLYFAMNKGLELATGDYLWFLNAGDMINDSEILNYFFSKETHYRDVYFGQTLIVDEKGNRIGSRRLKPNIDTDWRDFKWGMLICHQSILVKKSIAPNFDTRYKIAADYAWVLESLKRAKDKCGTRRYISSFLSGGLSSDNYFKANKERFLIMKEYFGLIPSLWYNFLIIFRFVYTVGRYKRI